MTSISQNLRYLPHIVKHLTIPPKSTDSYASLERQEIV